MALCRTILALAASVDVELGTETMVASEGAEASWSQQPPTLEEVLEFSLPAGSSGALRSQMHLSGLESSESLLCKMAE